MKELPSTIIYSKALECNMTTVLQKNAAKHFTRLRFSTGKVTLPGLPKSAGH